MRCFPLVLVAFLATTACSSSDDSEGGSGGSSSGGASSGGTGSGGTATGGASGASGATAVGGGAGAGGDTWGNFAEEFFATYCIECHGAGDAQRDYSTIDDVIRDQDEIACGVAPTKLAGCASFPPPSQFPIDNATKTNPKPDTAARERLVAWIQAGTPE
jgi:hypothetical protein